MWCNIWSVVLVLAGTSGISTHPQNHTRWNHIVFAQWAGVFANLERELGLENVTKTILFRSGMPTKIRGPNSRKLPTCRRNTPLSHEGITARSMHEVQNLSVLGFKSSGADWWMLNLCFQLVLIRFCYCHVGSVQFGSVFKENRDLGRFRFSVRRLRVAGQERVARLHLQRWCRKCVMCFVS